MGWSKKAEIPPAPEPEPTWQDALNKPAFDWMPELSVIELTLLSIFMTFLLGTWMYGRSTPMKKKAVLNMAALNRVNIFKECFLGYVNAGMLEPIMAIASSEYDVTWHSLFINACQLLGLFSWLYLLSDAFDMTDTQQAFVYWDRVTAQGTLKDLPAWLKKSSKKTEAAGLTGSFSRDLSLWFMLACSCMAVCGVVGHRDVIHSHALIVLWAVLHHQARNATAWRGTGYFHTFFAPSAALLPLEYCLNLIDQEMIGDESGLEDLGKFREFIADQTGVWLDIEA